MRVFMINGVTMALNVDDILRAALKEDITSEDVSTNAVVMGPSQGSAQLIAKQDGVLAGLKVFERVFWLLDPSVKFETEYQDGKKRNADRYGFWRYARAAERGTYRTQLFAANERHCYNDAPVRGNIAGQQNQAARYPKNNAEYAGI